MSNHKQSSIAQFMYKNLHLLGFQNKQRVLNVAYRELIDNSLDACAKAKVLPQIHSSITYEGDREYSLVYRDNGPAITATNLPNICCRLLYGDKFDSTTSYRGQQGIGLTALFLYSQKTTGKKVVVITKRPNLKPVQFVLSIDLKTNRPIVHTKRTLESSPIDSPSGLYFKFYFKATYLNAGKKATKELLKQYALLNPNLKLTYTDPEGNVSEYPRYSTQILSLGVGNKIVPHHLEFGQLKAKMAQYGNTLQTFLEAECESTPFHIKKTLSLLSFNGKIFTSSLNEYELSELYNALEAGFSSLKPSTGRIFLLGDVLISSVTENGKIYYDYNCTHISKPKYYEGGVLQVEASCFYGNKDLGKDQKINLVRVANGSPLFYQQSSCVITKAVSDFNWKNCGLAQSGSELPRGSMLLIVHVSSTKVPYITESKDAIADNEIIREAIEQSLKKIAKGVRAYLVKLKAYDSRLEKELVIATILPELKATIAKALNKPEPSYSIALNAKIMNTIVYRATETDTQITYQFFSPLDEERTFNIAYYGETQLMRCKLQPNKATKFVIKKDPELTRLGTRIVFNGLSPVEYHKLTDTV